MSTAPNDRLKLRAEKRKQKIGFESQKQKQEKHEMAKERHKWGALLAQAKVDHRKMIQTAPAIVSAIAPTQALSGD